MFLPRGPVGVRTNRRKFLQSALSAAGVITLPFVVFRLWQVIQVSSLSFRHISALLSSLQPCFSQGILLGHSHRCVPDRGRMERGRQRRVDLGPLHPHAGQSKKRRQRRRSLRLLSPLARRHRAHASDEPEELSVLDLLAADSAERHRRAEYQRNRLLQPSLSMHC